MAFSSRASCGILAAGSSLQKATGTTGIETNEQTPLVWAGRYNCSKITPNLRLGVSSSPLWGNMLILRLANAGYLWPTFDFAPTPAVVGTTSALTAEIDGRSYRILPGFQSPLLRRHFPMALGSRVGQGTRGSTDHSTVFVFCVCVWGGFSNFQKKEMKTMKPHYMNIRAGAAVRGLPT